jgi:hypothetical protein
MSELKDILREEYIKQINSLDLKMLLEMVEEALDSPIQIIDEDDAKSGVALPKAMQFDPKKDKEKALEMVLKMIPNIEVSEIGWSDVRTPKTGEEISGPQRQLLEGYLSNIGNQGDDFEAKITKVSEFYTKGPEMIQEVAGDDRTKRMVQAISYLVFYKTLTKVITNFNASSAGFSFESFLAALVNGKQVQTNSGTIADYTDRSNKEGKMIPVSLKLYREGGLIVGGSYKDLVRDLTMSWPSPQPWVSSFPNAMRYVVCTKTLSGEDLNQEGSIHFYQFDFTLDNVVDILADSMDTSKKCIMLSKDIVSQAKAMINGRPASSIKLDLPDAGTLPSPQELQQTFVAALANIIKEREIPLSEEQFQKLLDELDWAQNDDLFQPADPKRFGGVPQGVVRGVSATSATKRKEIVAALFKKKDKMDPEGLPWRPRGRESLASAIGLANKVVTDEHSSSKKADARNAEIARMVQDGEFYSPEESLKAYNIELKSAEQKKVALLNSWGWLTTGHFSLNQTQALNSGAPTYTKDLKAIKIGRKEVENVVNTLGDIINEEMSEIFQSLKILSDSLNIFFAGGLEEDQYADAAVKNAQNISSKPVLQKEKK